MSKWHLSWQECFAEQYREVIIVRDGVKHRADICINDTVIEFHNSQITGKKIAERNAFYLACGYKMVWVFDATDKIKNDFGDSIDPIECRDDDLCWKRAKQQFAIDIPTQVKVYIQCRPFISNDTSPDQEYDIMLLLTEITPKFFTFYQTIPDNIVRVNFPKQYGAILSNDVLSVDDIIKKTEQYKQEHKRIISYTIPIRTTYQAY